METKIKRIYSTNNSNIQVYVNHYKTIYNVNGIKLRQYQNKCTLIIDTSSQTFTTTKSAWISSIVPSGLRPGNPVSVMNYANSNTYVSINNDGGLYKWCNSGSINASVWCELSWNY